MSRCRQCGADVGFTMPGYPVVEHIPDCLVAELDELKATIAAVADHARAIKAAHTHWDANQYQDWSITRNNMLDIDKHVLAIMKLCGEAET